MFAIVRAGSAPFLVALLSLGHAIFSSLVRCRRKWELFWGHFYKKMWFGLGNWFGLGIAWGAKELIVKGHVEIVT
jgi:hypothetical protein